MIDQISAQLARHRSTGVFVDTNLIVPLLIGRVDPQLIATFKRSRQHYTTEDYHLLELILERTNKIVVTPNVLTEVYNLLNTSTLAEPRKGQLQIVFQKFIIDSVEIHSPSSTIAQREEFFRFGLTDAGILEVVIRQQCLLLTDDSSLFIYLSGTGVDAIKFSYLRDNF